MNSTVVQHIRATHIEPRTQDSRDAWGCTDENSHHTLAEIEPTRSSSDAAATSRRRRKHFAYAASPNIVHHAPDASRRPEFARRHGRPHCTSHPTWDSSLDSDGIIRLSSIRPRIFWAVYQRRVPRCEPHFRRDGAVAESGPIGLPLCIFLLHVRRASASSLPISAGLT